MSSTTGIKLPSSSKVELESQKSSAKMDKSLSQTGLHTVSQGSLCGSTPPSPAPQKVFTTVHSEAPKGGSLLELAMSSSTGVRVPSSSRPVLESPVDLYTKSSFSTSSPVTHKAFAGDDSEALKGGSLLELAMSSSTGVRVPSSSKPVLESQKNKSVDLHTKSSFSTSSPVTHKAFAGDDSEAPKGVSLLELAMSSSTGVRVPSSSKRGLESKKNAKASVDKPVSLTDLIMLSNKQNQNVKSATKTSMVDNPPANSSQSSVGADQAPSLSDLVKIHSSSKQVTPNTLASMLSEIESPSTKPQNIADKCSHGVGASTSTVTIQESLQSNQLFEKVLCESLAPQRQDLSALSMLVRNHIYKKTHTQLLSYFDFSTPSPDEQIKERQKRAFN